MKQWPYCTKFVNFPNMPLIIALPIFLSSPASDVGIHVCLANCCLARVIPDNNPDALSGFDYLFLEKAVNLSNPKDK